MKLSGSTANRIVIILLFGLCLFLSFNRHSKSGYFNYHSEIWADKAGYYVYLPAAFKFGFDPNQFPDSIDSKTGSGFELDYKEGKVYSKYGVGVAVMQLPFYLMAEGIATIAMMEPTGFTPVHHWFINVSAVFYLIIGLLVLSRFLRWDFDSKVVYAVIATIFLGTNLYYYSIDETGMSHVYSFALFSSLLFLLRRTEFLSRVNLYQLILIGSIAGLIVVIRPTNVMFLLAVFFLDACRLEQIQKRLSRIFTVRIFFPVLCGAVLFIIPQLLYWNYAFDNLVFYSYEKEGFQWLNPQIFHTLFSPNNGLFLYTPIFLFIVWGIVIMTKGRMINAIWLAALFIFTTYVFASWWNWEFGCSFGARNYVEYLAVYSIPLGVFYKRLKSWKSLQRILLTVGVLACVAFTLKMTYTYDECYYGKSHWDWNYYLTLVTSSPK